MTPRRTKYHAVNGRLLAARLRRGAPREKACASIGLDVKWARLLFLASEVVESGLADGFGNEVVDEDVMIELRAEVKRYAPGGDA